mmetsp:Transcript_62526/g.116240  ORF Transcript_62526/g.116240 Transcript_62526/m.116240 type:complete len:552 (+) Transcript_62526:28-1683(+)
MAVAAQPRVVPLHLSCSQAAAERSQSHAASRPGTSRLAASVAMRQSLQQASSTAVVAASSASVLVAAFNRRRLRKGSTIARRSRTTGPGWVDEVARLLDPRESGPSWSTKVGYRGRKAIRLLLDGEDLAHSYAAAMYEMTGKWTGPLSAGIEEALRYGAWAGGQPEDPHPDRQPLEPNLRSPEIMTFVALPADLIEAVAPGHLLDGYPEALREDIGRVVEMEDDVWLNKWIASLQEISRLFTWTRPARVAAETPRPNALMVQKYYEFSSPMAFQNLARAPMVLSQVMGAGSRLKVGQKVEALKAGLMVGGVWQPSKWERAVVKAVNYDGTYDLQFERKFGPFRDNRRYDQRGKRVNLSLARNERFKENWGADSMPASFRLMQELEYAEAVKPDEIRFVGSLDKLSELAEDEGSQDWYLVSSKQYILSASASSESLERLETFKRKFQLSYRWVPNEDFTSLRFEPVPTGAMAKSMQQSYKDVVEQFRLAAEALPDMEVASEVFEQEDDGLRAQLDEVKEQVAQLSVDVQKVPSVEADVPRRAAGPVVGQVVG